MEPDLLVELQASAPVNAGAEAAVPRWPQALCCPAIPACGFDLSLALDWSHRSLFSFLLQMMWILWAYLSLLPPPSSSGVCLQCQCHAWPQLTSGSQSCGCHSVTNLGSCFRNPEALICKWHFSSVPISLFPKTVLSTLDIIWRSTCYVTLSSEGVLPRNSMPFFLIFT